MNRDDYLAAVGRSLNFLDDTARAEVLADMAELYDGLLGRDMTDAEAQQRMGSPGAVAAEYRLVEELDRMDRSPGTAAGLRVGLATLSGQLARGAAFQLLGIVWLSLAIIALGVGICVVAGLALSVGVAAGFDPFVTTLAVPGIPPVSGVLMGLAVATASVALLLANRMVMRGLSRVMRNRLRRSRGSIASAGASSSGVQMASRRRWMDSGRATWHVTLIALVFSAGATGLMLVIPAPEFPVTVDRSERLELQDVETLEVRSKATDVRLVSGDTPEARLMADLMRTFAQSVELHVTADGSAVVVEALYREGLSWGINPRPHLVLTVRPEERARIVVHLENGAEVDLSGLSQNQRSRVTVER